MPYTRIQQLPMNVQRVLPKHAQDIYRKAFNAAWKQYANKQERDAPREEVAHRVAWSAVKTKYHKQDGRNWVKKE